MLEHGFILTCIVALARAPSLGCGAACSSNRRHHVQSNSRSSRSQSRRRPTAMDLRTLSALVLPAILALVSLVGLTTTAALACACGCSVFDVGGLDTPQEQDHGGRIFFEFWSGDQNQN